MSQRLFCGWGITQAHVSFLITAPHFSHYSPWLRGGKCTAPQMWHLSSFPLPPFLFASVLMLILTRFIFPNIFSKLLHFQPLLFWLCHSYLYKVVSLSSTYGVNQQCPLKDERIWGEMLSHSWTWRTTQTSPLGVFWSLCTEDLHVWL